MKSFLLLPSLLIWTWLITIIPHPARAQTPVPTDEVDALLADHMAELDIPGAAVAIVQGDEIVYMQGYGTADDSGRPVTPQTPFALASLSKSFTALAVMQLVEAGEVQLDAPVRQYLPWFRTADAAASAQITVRHLLHHTSGFSELEGYERNYEENDPDTIETSIRNLRDATLNHAPGETFEYSNTNYDVLGVLVETVSGQSYGEYVEEQLFDPLQMQNSYTTMKAARANGATRGYYPLFGWTTSYDTWMPYSQATRPAGGLWASAEDMGHYLIAHLNEGRYGETAVISPAGMATVHTPGATIGEEFYYAMGWNQFNFTDAAPPDDPEAAPVAQSHGGEWPNYRAIMVLVPERETGVVVLMNAADRLRNSQFYTAGWNATLLALGQETTDFPLAEDFVMRNGRAAGYALILILLIGMVWSIRQMRRLPAGRPGLHWIVLPLVLEISLVVYLFVWRLEGWTNLRLLLLGDAPDIGLMFLLIAVLTLGWGPLRTMLLWRNRQRT